MRLNEHFGIQFSDPALEASDRKIEQWSSKRSWRSPDRTFEEHRWPARKHDRRHFQPCSGTPRTARVKKGVLIFLQKPDEPIGQLASVRSIVLLSALRKTLSLVVLLRIASQSGLPDHSTDTVDCGWTASFSQIFRWSRACQQAIVTRSRQRSVRQIASLSPILLTVYLAATLRGLRSSLSLRNGGWHATSGRSSVLPNFGKLRLPPRLITTFENITLSKSKLYTYSTVDSGESCGGTSRLWDSIA